MIGVAGRGTSSYPKLKYGSITRSFAEAAVALGWTDTALRGTNVVASGKAEWLFGRLEESARLDLLCEADELAQLRWFFRDHASLGNQFEFWLDRQTGSVWTFEDTLRDQNLLVPVLSSGSETYADVGAGGRGLVLSSTQRLTVTLAQASANPKTGFDDPLLYSEGVVVLDVEPSWAPSGGTTHHFVDTGPSGSNHLNIFVLDTDLYLQVTDSGGTGKSVRGSVSWSSGQRVQIVASWAASGALSLWYAISGGAFVALTTAAGTGTGIISALPTTLTIGAQYGGAGGTHANGTYGSVAFFKKAVATPQLVLSGYRPVWRNYFPYGELQPLGPATLEPQRLSPARMIFRWPMLVRNSAP